jgi:chitodextrinase
MTSGFVTRRSMNMARFIRKRLLCVILTCLAVDGATQVCSGGTFFLLDSGADKMSYVLIDDGGVHVLEEYPVSGPLALAGLGQYVFITTHGSSTYVFDTTLSAANRQAVPVIGMSAINRGIATVDGRLWGLIEGDPHAYVMSFNEDMQDPRLTQIGYCTLGTLGTKPMDIAYDGDLLHVTDTSEYIRAYDPPGTISGYMGTLPPDHYVEVSDFACAGIELADASPGVNIYSVGFTEATDSTPGLVRVYDSGTTTSSPPTTFVGEDYQMVGVTLAGGSVYATLKNQIAKVEAGFSSQSPVVLFDVADSGYLTDIIEAPLMGTLRKTDHLEYCQRPDTLPYELSYVVTGPKTDVELVDTLPEDGQGNLLVEFPDGYLDANNETPDGGQYNPATHTITWDLGDVGVAGLADLNSFICIPLALEPDTVIRNECKLTYLDGGQRVDIMEAEDETIYAGVRGETHIWVSHTGSDGAENDGFTFDEPKKTIAEGIRLALEVGCNEVWVCGESSYDISQALTIDELGKGFRLYGGFFGDESSPFGREGRKCTLSCGGTAIKINGGNTQDQIADGEVIIDGFKFTGSGSGSAIEVSNGNVMVNHCELGTFRTAISAVSWSNLSVAWCTITGCSGDGINLEQVAKGSLVVHDSLVSGSARGIHAKHCDNEVGNGYSIFVGNSQILDNRDIGLNVESSRSLWVYNCTIRGNGNNRNTGDGPHDAGVYTASVSTVTIQDCVFENNIGRYSGARLDGGTIVVKDSSFAANAGEDGGALNLYDGTALVTNCSFGYNTGLPDAGLTSGNGGAIYCHMASVKVLGCSFNNNSAWDDGGAIFVSATSGLTIASSVFQGNQAYHGGAIRNNGSNLTCVNCTFLGNTVWDYEISQCDGHALKVKSTDTVENCLFHYPDSYDTTISIVEGISVSGSNHMPSDGNPFLNGYHLLPTPDSPCIDTTGSNPAIEGLDIDDDGKEDPDCDGNDRIVGGTVDIGAHESKGEGYPWIRTGKDVYKWGAEPDFDKTVVVHFYGLTWALADPSSYADQIWLTKADSLETAIRTAVIYHSGTNGETHTGAHYLGSSYWEIESSKVKDDSSLAYGYVTFDMSNAHGENRLVEGRYVAQRRTYENGQWVAKETHAFYIDPVPPGPIAWEQEPHWANDVIVMEAEAAGAPGLGLDAEDLDEGDIQYQFVTDPNYTAASSEWQTDPEYQVDDPELGTIYAFAYKARFTNAKDLVSDLSSSVMVLTPPQLELQEAGQKKIIVRMAPPTSDTAYDPTSDGDVEYRFKNTTTQRATDGWIDVPYWTDDNGEPDGGDLAPGTTYGYEMQFRRVGDPNESPVTTASFSTLTTGTGDSTAPEPNPMTWAVKPYATSNTSVDMTATTAVDVNETIKYFFDCNDSSFSSGWQESPSYEAIGLASGGLYSFRVKARDGSPNENETAFSEEWWVRADVDPPSHLTWGPSGTGETFLVLRVLATDRSEDISYYIKCLTTDENNDWKTTEGQLWYSDGTGGGQQYFEWVHSGLQPNTEYQYQFKASDGPTNPDSEWSGIQYSTTMPIDNNPPTPNPMEWADPCTPYIGSTMVKLVAVTAYPTGNWIEYQFECVNDPNFTSEWQLNNPVYEAKGLSPNTTYTFRVRARRNHLPEYPSDFSDPIYVTTDGLTSGVAQIVETGAWFATIGDAIYEAADKQTIEISPGTYYGTLDLGGKDLTLRGTDPNDWEVVESIIIDGNDVAPVVSFGDDSESKLEGLTITGGNDPNANGGGVFVHGFGEGTLIKCIIKDNVAAYGGGIYGPATVKKCLIENNTAVHFGGGAYGVLSMSDCELSYNSAGSSGGSSTGNDFTGDPNCVALWSLEDGALTTDSIGSNTLTNSGVTSDTTNYQEGSGAADFEFGDSDEMSIGDGSLDSGFPLKSGDTNKKISVCCWIKPESLASYRWLVSKYDYTNAKRSFAVALDESGHLGLFTGYNSGGSYEGHWSTSTLSTGSWYHIAVTYDDSDRSWRLRAWSAGSSSIVVDLSGTKTNNINIEDADWVIGNVDNATAYYDGVIDEVVVFNDILSSGEIDEIREATYGSSSGVSGCGGGVCGDGISLTNCILHDNSSGDSGGGFDSTGDSTVMGCVFIDNLTNGEGGGLRHTNGDLTLVNCTFIDNDADDGGGMYSTACASPLVTNSIFWGNTATSGDHIGGYQPYFYACAIEGAEVSSGYVIESGASPWNPLGYYKGGGFTSTNPSFTDDYHLSSSSVCVDAGLNPGELPVTDIDGNLRVWGDAVDIGADEYFVPDTTLPSPTTMTWATQPFAQDSNSISMVATTATDESLPIVYYFECVSDPNHDSGWQTSTTYTATGLTPETSYTFKVKARDAAGNATNWSSEVSVSTQSEGPVDIAQNLTTETWYTSIQDAIDAASNEDVIEIVEGTHAEAIDFDGKEIKLRGTDPNDWDVVEDTIINSLGTAPVVNFSSGSESTLEGLTVTGADDPNVYGGGVYVHSLAKAKISKCIIKDNTSSHGGGVYGNPSTTVSNCRIENNHADNYGGGVYGSEVTLENCYLGGNSADGDGGGLGCSGSAAAIGCVFYGNSANDDGGGVYHSSNQLTLANCTFVDNTASDAGGGMYSTNCSGAEVTNCIFWGNEATASSTDQIGGYQPYLHSTVVEYAYATGSYIRDQGTYTAIAYDHGGFVGDDPNFVDVYHLTSGSACIDAGESEPGLPSTDIDGDNRVLNGTIDIGADEYVQ